MNPKGVFCSGRRLPAVLCAVCVLAGTARGKEMDLECRVPPDAVGLAFPIPHAAVPPMSDWQVSYLEPEGDQWITRLSPMHLGAPDTNGVSEAFLPFSDANYMPWGDKKKGLASTRWIRFILPDDVCRAHAKKYRWVRRVQTPEPVKTFLPPLSPSAPRICVLDLGGAEDRNVLAALERLSIPARTVTAAGLASTSVFSRASCDLLIIPTSPRFPRAAVDNFRAFLRARGAFLAFGGYAFDDLGDGVRWATAREMDEGKPFPQELNSRVGRSGHGFRTANDVIGVFDPSFKIEHAAACRTAPDGLLLPPGRPWILPGVTNGYHAACLIASRNRSSVTDKATARRISVLEAVDRFGRSRGPVLSLAVNHAGPYAGSVWAYTAHPRLFKTNDPVSDALLAKLCGVLRDPAFLTTFRTEWMAYDPGETVRFNVTRQGGGEVRICHDGRAVPPDGFRVAADEARPMLAFTCELVRDGRVVDRLETGVVIRRPVYKAPSFAIRENYLEIGGKRGFHGGINTLGRVWGSDNENPLVWRRDCTLMADYGMTLYRAIQMSAFARPGDYTDCCNVETLRGRPEETGRATDALIAVANACGLLSFISFHDWMPLTLTDEQLALQADWNAWWTARYRGRGAAVLWDIQNEPQMPSSYRIEKRDWRDRAARDEDRARARAYARWMTENARGARRGDPSARLTVGNDQDLPAAEKHLSTDGIDFMNVHYYQLPRQFRGGLKLTDRRFEGKGFSLGEFGSSLQYETRAYRGEGTADELSIRYYLEIVHTAFGLGSAFVAAWAFKDFTEVVHPWGLFHEDMTPKPLLRAYRNMILPLKDPEIAWVPPETWLVLPDSFRIGGRTRTVHEGLRTAADSLMRLDVPYGVINEESLDRLPESAKALVWPMAVCPSDRTFARVAAFVRAGGALLVTGDFRWSEDRKPDRTDRPAMLGLARVSARPADPFADAAPAVQTGPRVLWHPAACELKSAAETEAVYRTFFTTCARAVRRVAIDGLDGEKWLCFSLPLTDGGRADVAVEDVADFRGRVVYERWSPDGRLLALTCDNERRGVKADGGPCAFVSKDGRDVRVSRDVLVLPLGARACTLPALSVPTAAETGEWREGTWTALETRPLAQDRPRRLVFDDATRYDARRLRPDHGNDGT